MQRFSNTVNKSSAGMGIYVHVIRLPRQGNIFCEKEVSQGKACGILQNSNSGRRASVRPQGKSLPFPCAGKCQCAKKYGEFANCCDFSVHCLYAVM